MNISRWEAYSVSFSTPPMPLLKEIAQITESTMPNPNACSGDLQGSFLAVLSKLISPSLVVEVGTFTAYGTICLAQGLAPLGKMITMESNFDLEDLIRRHIRKAGLTDRIDLWLGKALDLLPQVSGPVDLAFIDAAKREYIDYYELLVPKMSAGGLILADNVLWKGKVLDPGNDKIARDLHAFNAHVRDDPRTENVILPVRDGLNVIRKC